MKKANVILAVIAALTLSSCERGCQSLKRDIQSSKMHYDIKVYSGGQMIYHDNLETILNNSSHSDGYYYYKGDTLVEICGQAVIKAE